MDEQVRTELKRRGVPDPPAGVIERWRYVALNHDWYVMINDKWYWFGAETGNPCWKHCPNGPFD